VGQLLSDDTLFQNCREGLGKTIRRVKSCVARKGKKEIVIENKISIIFAKKMIASE
jgi:hypothetical protein